jgi:MFS family permease
MPFGRTLALLWRCRTYRILMVYVAMTGFVLSGLSQWWPSLLTREHELPMSAVGVYLGLATGTGMGIGLLSGGFIANKATERDVRLPLLIGVGALVLLLPAALGSILSPFASAAVSLIFLTLLLNSVAVAPVIATIYAVVTARMRAMAGAISIFFQSVVGFGLGPLCVGALSDFLAPSFGPQSLRYALIAPICLIPVMSIVLYRAARALPNDLNAPGIG